MKQVVYKNYDDLPLMLSVPEVAAVLGISRAGAYELVKCKEFPALKIGSRIVVPKEKFIGWIDEKLLRLLTAGVRCDPVQCASFSLRFFSMSDLKSCGLRPGSSVLCCLRKAAQYRKEITMMSRKREAICMGIGILAGVTLCGPAAQAATEAIAATLSSQLIYVDGQQVSMTAYAINGNNYVKLRDVGEAVGFNVYWDGGAVQIESDKPYTGEAPAEPELTEANVQAAIRALRDTYPTNTYYGAYYRSYSDGPYGAAPTACAGWATLCSDAAFSNLPWRRINDPSWEDIRPRDLIRYDNTSGGHVIVVLDKTDEYVVVTESGTNNKKARWGGQYFRWWLEERSGYTCFTRYPQ